MLIWGDLNWNDFEVKFYFCIYYTYKEIIEIVKYVLTNLER